MKTPEDIIRASITNTLSELEATHRALDLPPDEDEIDEVRVLLENIEQRIREERARQWFAARWQKFKAKAQS